MSQFFLDDVLQDHLKSFAKELAHHLKKSVTYPNVMNRATIVDGDVTIHIAIHCDLDHNCATQYIYTLTTTPEHMEQTYRTRFGYSMYDAAWDAYFDYRVSRSVMIK
jgi:hypothetical protein